MSDLKSTGGAARLRTKLASVALVTAMASAGAVAALAGPASALPPPPHPRCAPGTYWDGSECVPNPPTLPPAIYRIAPTSGWGGDAVWIGGTGLAGATSVTFVGLPVTSFAAADDEIATTVPAGITWKDYGATQIPVTVVTPTVTLTASYTVSPTLSRNNAEADWSSNDGLSTSTTSVSIDRLSGFLAGGTRITSATTLFPMSVEVSILFADSTGKMVGYTNPYWVTTPKASCFFVCTFVPVATGFAPGPLVIGPDAGVALGVHTIQIVQVRDPKNELAATLAAYQSESMQLAAVVIAISGRFG